MMQEESRLLDPQFLRKLERMQIVNKRMIRGSQVGKRKSRNVGSSIEFADYRSYSPGDDLRQLDWNAYARLGKLFLKTFLDEQEWHISLYIDCSKSMEYGQPSKFKRAVQLAAALGYIGLHHYDRVSVFAFDQNIIARSPALLGKGKVNQLFHFFEGLSIGQEGNMNQALYSGAAVHGKPGMAFIFSDFLFEEGYEKGINFVQASGQEVCLVQILAEEERNPELQGDICLVDSETLAGREIAVSPPILAGYQRALKDYQDKLAHYSFKRGMSFIDVHPEHEVAEIIYQVFQKSGLIR